MRIKYLLAAVIIFPTAAMADGDAPPGAPADTTWHVDLGLGDVLAPAYPGAKAMRNHPLPAVSIAYKDRVFFSLQDGVRVNLIDQAGFTAGPLLSFDFGRSASADRKALTGLADVSFFVAAGGFVSYDFGHYASVHAQVSKAFTGSKGLDIGGGITFKAPPLFSSRLFLSAGPTIDYYDGNYSKAYFGITPAEAPHSIYRAFTPKSGEEIGVSADAEYLISARTSLNIFGEFGKYTGGIARSPILHGPYGTSTQYAIDAALTYRFNG